MTARWNATFFVLAMFGGVAVGCGTDEPSPTTTPPSPSPVRVETPSIAKPAPPPVVEPPKVVGIHGKQAVVTTSRGELTLEFYADDAPKSTARFLELAQSGFYDGLRFHRVEKGSLVQTGDPTGTGRGGSGVSIPFEENDRRHLIGSVGLARGPDPNSADSQFYICMRSIPELDGEYVIFARVVSGLSVIRRIEEGDVMEQVVVIDKESP